LALIALLAICRGILMTREWASGWVPSLIAAVSILAIRFPRTAALIFLLSLVAVVPMIPWISDFVMVGDQSYSLMTRIEAARISSEIIRSSFLFGTGPANYYFYTPLYPILGWHVPFSFHNNFLDLAAQYGLLGLLLMIWFLIASGILCFRLIKQLEDGFNRAFTIAVLGGFVGTVMAGLLGDWIIPFVYNVGIPGFRTSLLGWVFLGCLSSFKTFYQIDDPVNQP
jgi:O-antigen ligase